MGRITGITRLHVTQLTPGTHVLVPRLGYCHHGIYIGGGEFVHKVAGRNGFAAASFSCNASVIGAGGGVVRSGLEGFCPEDDPVMFELLYDTCFSPEDTVSLAISGLSNEPGYRLLEANCEHFATWCKTGEKVSYQVLQVRNFLSQMLAVSAGGIVGTQALTKLDIFKNTTVQVVEKKGTYLGLRDKKVTTTVIEVDARRVLTGAALIGFA
eukprot:CAMPEP_0198220708 /NCGR_PEP_ID=MMETSP1445-20131203/80380_1 /TAXON_ID=36898 /ORGANISM="Pyramimonas sp., Strain CCMP2087" /LENGTH=210 /DNA_ID=CAMNT_0043898591 /DNA_START=91 /DNA_END=719 /DNA_ORIENTATION=+